MCYEGYQTQPPYLATMLVMGVMTILNYALCAIYKHDSQKCVSVIPYSNN